MSDFWHKASRIAHSVAFGLGAVAHALSHRPHFHRPHFHRPHFDRHIGLRNWFHAQWRIPRRPHPLPPFYQALHDRMVDRIMARAHNREMIYHRPRMATAPFHRHER